MKILISSLAIILGFAATLQAAEPVAITKWTKTQSFRKHKDGSITANSSKLAFTRQQRETPATSFTFSADVVVDKTLGDGWKSFGVMAFTGYKNYWCFNLVEAPESRDNAHALELRAMVNGKWGYNNGLYKTVQISHAKYNWEVGVKYKMTISINPEGVSGVLADEEGKELAKIKFKFNKADFWKGGTPGFRVAGFKATITNPVITEGAAAEAKPEDK